MKQNFNTEQSRVAACRRSARRPVSVADPFRAAEAHQLWGRKRVMADAGALPPGPIIGLTCFGNQLAKAL